MARRSEARGRAARSRHAHRSSRAVAASPVVAEGAASVAPDAPSPARGRSRTLIFAALCAVCLLVAGGYAALAMTRERPQAAAAAAAPPPSAGSTSLAPLGSGPGMLYLKTDGGPYREIGLAATPPASAEPLLSSVQCQRVYFAAGQGICVGMDLMRGGAFLFDAQGTVKHTLPTSGIPSRARVSPDGRYASMTTFVAGDSYSDGSFSTRTSLIDTAAGTVIADLEQFAVERDGQPFSSPDFNFWGVTFARDSNRFYATLGTGGKTYLVEGDVAARRLKTVRENVECPSLSPDNSRLVFKKRVPGGQWMLFLLDLATMEDRPMGEARNVDDQVEWLDDGHILYQLRDEGPPPTIRPDIWLLPVDGGAPSLYLKGAMSPSVRH